MSTAPHPNTPGSRGPRNSASTGIQVVAGCLSAVARSDILTHGNKTVEFDSKGKVVWRVDNSDVAGRFADPCGGQRLPNGNTIICSYGQRKPNLPKVFEVTRDKKVVWEYIHPKLDGIHEIHVLTTNGKSVREKSLR